MEGDEAPDLSYHEAGSDAWNPRAAGGGGHKVPPLRFVKYIRHLMSYEQETWHNFK